MVTLCRAAPKNLVVLYKHTLLCSLGSHSLSLCRLGSQAFLDKYGQFLSTLLVISYICELRLLESLDYPKYS
jgi:hypothetical protein